MTDCSSTTFGQRFFGGYSLSTISCSRRFVTNGETLSPFPDGIIVPVDRSYEPNPTLLDSTISSAQRARINVRSCLRNCDSPGGHRGRKQPAYAGRERRMVSCVDPSVLRAKNGECGNDLGYWTVVYVTEEGRRVGACKLADSCGKGPYTFEGVVRAIEENANFLNLKVSYITFLDNDFEAFTLLTSRTVQNCTDSFRVVVDLPADAPMHDPSEEEPEGEKENAKANNVVGKEVMGSSEKQADELVEASNVHSSPHTEEDVSAPEREMPEHCLEEQLLLLYEEAAQREAVCMDEASCWLITQARADVGLTFWPRGPLW